MRNHAARPPAALVINVADPDGVEIVRFLADLGLGVGIHFTGHRQAVDRLVAEIWDRGGRVCALDGAGPDTAGLDTLLRRIRPTLGNVQMIIDASARTAFDGRFPMGARCAR